MLYIDPQECIDCDGCVPECPVQAIFPGDQVPGRWAHFIPLNAARVVVLKVEGRHITEKQEAMLGPGCGGPK
jgi:ferredoxin